MSKQKGKAQGKSRSVARVDVGKHYSLDTARGIITVRLDEIPAPTRAFTCQSVRLDRLWAGGKSIHVMFGQMVVPGRLTALAVLQVEYDSLRRVRKTFNAGFRASVRLYASEDARPPALAEEQIASLDAARIWTSSASMCRATVSANVGAQIDWFMFTPRNLRLVAEQREPANGEGVEPIVAVSMSCGCLASFLDQLDTLISGSDNVDGGGADTALAERDDKNE